MPSGNLQRSGDQIRKLSSVPVSLYQADSYLDSLHILNVLHGEQQKSWQKDYMGCPWGNQELILLSQNWEAGIRSLEVLTAQEQLFSEEQRPGGKPNPGLMLQVVETVPTDLQWVTSNKAMTSGNHLVFYIISKNGLSPFEPLNYSSFLLSHIYSFLAKASAPQASQLRTVTKAKPEKGPSSWQHGRGHVWPHCMRCFVRQGSKEEFKARQNWG